MFDVPNMIFNDHQIYEKSCPPNNKTTLKESTSIVHCSNLFGIPGQQALADKLVSIISTEASSRPGRVLFCNSGAEANEALMKLALSLIHI